MCNYWYLNRAKIKPTIICKCCCLLVSLSFTRILTLIFLSWKHLLNPAISSRCWRGICMYCLVLWMTQRHTAEKNTHNQACYSLRNFSTNLKRWTCSRAHKLTNCFGTTANYFKTIAVLFKHILSMTKIHWKKLIAETLDVFLWI